jgi:hypothetical protein
MRSSTVSGPRLDARPRGEPRIVPWAGPPPPGLQGYQSLAQPVELHRLARDHVLAEGAGGAGHRREMRETRSLLQEVLKARTP